MQGSLARLSAVRPDALGVRPGAVLATAAVVGVAAPRSMPGFTHCPVCVTAGEAGGGPNSLRSSAVVRSSHGSACSQQAGPGSPAGSVRTSRIASLSQWRQRVAPAVNWLTSMIFAVSEVKSRLCPLTGSPSTLYGCALSLLTWPPPCCAELGIRGRVVAAIGDEFGPRGARRQRKVRRTVEAPKTRRAPAAVTRARLEHVAHLSPSAVT